MELCSNAKIKVDGFDWEAVKSDWNEVLS
jgi:hypothetical protein